jgi:hypothetical protein
MTHEVDHTQVDLGKLEGLMQSVEQVECPVFHNFAPGVYIREMHAEKGTVILGKRHRYETCNILLKGSLLLYTGNGNSNKTIKAPMIFNSNPGVRKLALVLEDTIFLNVHPTDETDLEIIEDKFIIPEEEYLMVKGGKKCLG